jgi:hypothetical protein
MPPNYAFSQKIDAVDAMLNAARRLSPTNLLLEELARHDGQAPLPSLSQALATLTPAQIIDTLLTASAGGLVAIDEKQGGKTQVKLTDAGRNAVVGSGVGGEMSDAGRRGGR